MTSHPNECERFREELSALLDGELAPEREATVRAHVAGCARCREELASLERVDPWLARVPVPPVGAELLAKLRARIAASAESRRRRRARGLFAAAAAAAAALALYLALPRSRAPIVPAPAPPPPEVARVPVPQPPAPIPAPAETGVPQPRDPDFDALQAEEIAVGLELDTAQDLEVIANLELLEAFVALEEGRG